MIDDRIPFKIKLTHEQNDEHIQKTFEILFNRLSELSEYVLSISNINSLLLNMVTSLNRLLMLKGLISSEELDKQLAEFKLQSDQMKQVIFDKQEELNDILISDVIVDTYDDKIFDKYNDSEIVNS